MAASRDELAKLLAAKDDVDWSKFNQPTGEASVDRSTPSPIAHRTASPLVNITEQDIADATDKAMAFSGGGLGIKAYHGSPHDFNQFDLGKIGTGEGAQAYGHGLYFAEQEAVAQAYRDMLARVPNKGKMYEVDINANPEHFLDWDKKFTEQPKHIQDIIRSSGIHPEAPGPMGTKVPSDLPAGLLAGKRLQDPSSLLLRKLDAADIPGIKYLDKGSRGAGTGSRNYVVRDTDLIKIMRKYGLAGAAPVGLGALAASDRED